MPKRIKPSSWRRAGLEPVPAYTPDVLDEIVSLAGDLAPKKAEKLKADVLAVAEWLQVDLHYESRPSVPEKRVSLDNLRSKLVEASRALQRLDPDTRASICAVAEREPCPPSEAGLLYIGDLRLSWAGDEIAKVRKWARQAKRDLAPPRRGAPAKDAVFRAVVNLGKAWGKAKGVSPTRRHATRRNGRLEWSVETGPFRRFANAALKPLGEDVSDDMARRAIAALNK
jgi:hypothetical protein